MAVQIVGQNSSYVANVDILNNLWVSMSPNAISTAAAPWTSATVVNTTQVFYSTGAWSSVIVQFNQTSTITGGVVTLEGTFDGINWVSVPLANVLNPLTFVSAVNPYTLQPNTNEALLITSNGFQSIRARLSTAITGTGSATVYWSLLANNPAEQAGTTIVTNTVNTTLSDGTNGPAAVKPPSTSPLTTDKALVVSISPNSSAITASSAGSGTSNSAAAAWTSSTTNNTTVAIFNSNFSYNTAIVTFSQTSTISGGAANFEVSNDGTNWLLIPAAPLAGGNTTSSYNFNPNTYIAYSLNISGWQYARVRLSPVITGTGTVTIGFAVQTSGQPVVLVREAKDTGRTYITFFVDSVNGIISEALETMTVNTGGSTSTTTQYTVPAGKTLRLQSYSTSVQGTNSTVQTSKVRVRSAGTVSASSPIIQASFTGTTGTTNNIGNHHVSFPDGIEIAGGQQIGMSHLESSTSTNVTVFLAGYEY